MESRRPIQGCLTCHFRKVKCDARRPGCQKCEKLGVNCTGYSSSDHLGAQQVESIVTQAYRESGRKRRRTKGSCYQCRAAKSRCDQSRPSCTRCCQRSIECTFPPSKNNHSATEDAASNPSPMSEGACSRPNPQQRMVHGEPAEPSRSWLFSDTLPSEKDRIEQLVRMYFKRVHTIRCYSFLHSPTFMQAVDSENVQRVYGLPLLLIICSLGARLILREERQDATQEGKTAGAAWAEKAQSLVFHDPGNVSLNSLMAMVLLWEYHSRYGSNSSGMMVAACCSRAAQLLRLDVSLEREDSPSDSPSRSTFRESRRRLFWACWQIDVMAAAGIERLLTLARSAPDVLLPCDEQRFIIQAPDPWTKLIPEPLESPSHFPSPPLSLEAYHIRISYLRNLSLRCIRDSLPRPSPWEEGSAFRSLINELQQWKANLPQYLQCSDRNMYIHRDQNRIAMFVAMHTVYHVCHTDLFRSAIPSYDFPICASLVQAPQEFLRMCQSEARNHAEHISHLFELGLRHGEVSFDDTLCQAAAFESNRIQMAIQTIHDGALPTPTSGISTTKEDTLVHNLEVNMAVLDLSIHKISSWKTCVAQLAKQMRACGLTQLATTCSARANILSGDSTPEELAQRGQASRNGRGHEQQNPLGILREAWKEVETSQNADNCHQTETSRRSSPPEGGQSGIGQAAGSLERNVLEVPESSVNVDAFVIPAAQDPRMDDGLSALMDPFPYDFEPDLSLIDPFAPWSFDGYRT